jgi:divalent metal cation (Fe/Co/Zn/Cd) transporter
MKILIWLMAHFFSILIFFLAITHLVFAGSIIYYWPDLHHHQQAWPPPIILIVGVLLLITAMWLVFQSFKEYKKGKREYRLLLRRLT